MISSIASTDTFLSSFSFFIFFSGTNISNDAFTSELKTIRKAIDRQERNSSGYVEDRVRDCAASMFGICTMRRFLVKCLYDLIVLSNPQDYSHEDIVAGESQLEEFARAHFHRFVKAFYEHLCSKVEDPSHVLANNPWVMEATAGEGTDGNISVTNIKACGGVLNNSQNELKKRILYALESTDSVMSPFRRSAGPGFPIVAWVATSEFLGELEVDCRGKVDLLLTTHRAVVVGAEIKTSASDIPKAKVQLIRRFKIIATCLAATHKIKIDDSIFVGRVFYRNVSDGSTAALSEDASGNDLKTLSFYYHRV